MGKVNESETPWAKGFFLLLIFFFVVVPPARADDWDRIRKEAGNIQTINARFVQEKHLEILIKPFISKGAFYFQAPGSLRWEYFSPIKSILVMHDGAVRRFIGSETGFKEDASPGLQAMEMVLQEISLWLKGKFTDNPNYAATLEGHNKIVMVPRDRAFKKIIQRIEIMLSDRPGVIDTVMIYEGKTSFTSIRFQDVKINEGVAETLFESIP